MQPLPPRPSAPTRAAAPSRPAARCWPTSATSGPPGSGSRCWPARTRARPSGPASLTLVRGLRRGAAADHGRARSSRDGTVEGFPISGRGGPGLGGLKNLAGGSSGRRPAPATRSSGPGRHAEVGQQPVRLGAGLAHHGSAGWALVALLGGDGQPSRSSTRRGLALGAEQRASSPSAGRSRAGDGPERDRDRADVPPLALRGLATGRPAGRAARRAARRRSAAPAGRAVRGSEAAVRGDPRAGQKFAPHYAVARGNECVPVLAEGAETFSPPYPWATKRRHCALWWSGRRACLLRRRGPRTGKEGVASGWSFPGPVVHHLRARLRNCDRPKILP